MQYTLSENKDSGAPHGDQSASVVAAAFPAARACRVDVQQSRLTVRVFRSGLFRAFADDHVIKAPLAEGSLGDSATPRVQIVVDARRMRVLGPKASDKDRGDVQTRLLGSEVLDRDPFPKITFQSSAIQRVDPNRWLVRGELGLHGQTHAISVKVALEGQQYKRSATVRPSDFGITPIRIAGGTVEVKGDVTIDFDIVASER